MIRKIIFAAGAVFLFSGAFAQEKVISGDKIPSEIYDFVNKNFPDSKIVRVEHDRDLTESTYEVDLDNRTEITFSADKKPIEVDSETALPKDLIPVEISNYVTETYPDAFINGWEKEGKNHQIELSNGVDLVFDDENNLVEMDD